MSTSINSTFSKNKETVFNACLSAVATLGYAIGHSNKDSGTISFETEKSLRTYAGQRLSCTIIELGENQTQLIISATMKQHADKFQVSGMGEGKSIAQKILNKTAEILGESVTSENSKSGACFIATAALGSYDHPTVVELRYFRDEWILKQSWGNSFVTFYYKYGSIVAKKIENKPSLKRLSYLFIVKPIQAISRLIFISK